MPSSSRTRRPSRLRGRGRRGRPGAGAWRAGIHQPNASRMIAQLEAVVGTVLLERDPRCPPTSAGSLCGAVPRVARRLESTGCGTAVTRRGSAGRGVDDIAEHRCPLARRTAPSRSRSAWTAQLHQVLAGVHDGGQRLRRDAPPPRDARHDPARGRAGGGRRPWSLAPCEAAGSRRAAATPLVVRGRPALRRLRGAPACGRQTGQELAATPCPHRRGLRRPAVLSSRSAAGWRADSCARARGRAAVRRLLIVWNGPRRLSGPAADLVAVATAATPPPR